ncbi:nitroreductase family deazaflavin-dependent oxidoreductase [Nocardia terpenica]
MPNNDYHQFQRRVSAAFRANNGCVGGRFDGKAFIVLTTIGARTGCTESARCTTFDIDGRAAVVAARFGGARKPGGGDRVSVGLLGRGVLCGGDRRGGGRGRARERHARKLPARLIVMLRLGTWL